MATFTHGKSTRFFLSDTAVALTGTAISAYAAGTGTARVYDVGQYCKEVSFPRKMDTAETSTFGSNAKTYVQGLSDQTLSISGSWDSTSLVDLAGGTPTSLDGLLAGLIGATTNPTFAYCPTGVAVGKVVYNGSLVMTSYQVSGSIGDLVGFSAEFQIASFSTANGRILFLT